MDTQDRAVQRRENGQLLKGSVLNPRGVGGRTLAAALANWGKRPPSKKYAGDAETNLDAVAESLYYRATVDRDVAAIRTILDRTLGPVPQRLEVAQLTDDQILGVLDRISNQLGSVETEATDLDPENTG